VIVKSLARTATAISPLELAVGDTVLEHGATLRITAQNHRWTDQPSGRVVVNWLTEYVEGTTGWADIDAIMKRGDYHVQGNELARVLRLPR